MRTTIVGGYPPPPWLRRSRRREDLRDAMMVVLKTQELAGIELLGDGELYRWDSQQHKSVGDLAYFARKLGGVRSDLSAAERSSLIGRGVDHPPGIVDAEISAGSLNLTGAYHEFRSLTTLPTKFTVVSPYALAKRLADFYYEDINLLMFAIAEVFASQVGDLDCDVLQIDEPVAASRPAEAAQAANGLNMLLATVQAETAVHIFPGSVGESRSQPCDFAAVVALINMLQVDCVALEMSHYSDSDLRMLAEIRSDIRLDVGVVDVSSPDRERPAVVAKRIERVAKVVGVERVAYIHPDCGLWKLPRDAADGKLRSLSLGRREFFGFRSGSV